MISANKSSLLLSVLDAFVLPYENFQHAVWNRSSESAYPGLISNFRGEAVSLLSLSMILAISFS
jgi:hypothetical protein